MIPCDDANLRIDNIRRCAVNAQEVLNRIGARDPFVSIIFLDCCRDYLLRNQGLRGAEEPRGLKTMSMKTRGGSVIGFACDPGKTASDGSGRNGRYTKHLLMNITKPNEEIQDLLVYVTDGVEEESSGEQRPWQHTSLRRRNIFLAGASVAVPFKGSNTTLISKQKCVNIDPAYELLPLAQQDTLWSGEGLKQTERITSQNGTYYLVMQEDGDLVLYASEANEPDKTLWSSGTNSSGPNHLEVQSDGNLVVYDSSNEPVWASDSVTEVKVNEKYIMCYVIYRCFLRGLNEPV